MAQKKTTSRQSSSRTGKGGNGSRPAERARQSENDSTREYRRFVSREESDPGGPPDVLLDVPELRIDLIHFELDDLDAHLAVKANVLNLVKLNVGIDVHLSRVKLDIKGVEVEAVLKARLDHVTAVVDRLMTSLDRNPELVEGLSRAISEVGQGAGEAVDKTGDAAKEVGKGAEGALEDVGQGAGQAVGDVGEGAGQAVGDVGQGAGQAVGDVGQGAGQAVGDVGQGAGQAAGNLDQLVGGAGQTLGQLGQGAGQAVGGVGQEVGQLGQAATGALGNGQAAQGGEQNGGAHPAGQANGGVPGTGPGELAKVVVKTVAQEIRHAASDEARDLGLAATRKVRELGERREQRRAEKHNATDAALRIADELGVDLAHVEGTGSGGRITVKDVQQLQGASQ
jgi:2-oxoacid dehydrogenase-like protein with E3 subunit-binding domain